MKDCCNIERKEGLNFGEALEKLKRGRKIARSGWNGKGMWLIMKLGSSSWGMEDLHTFECCKKEVNNIEDVAHIIEFEPVICMKTANNKVQEGWVASQQDMFATDWCIVE